VNSWICARQRLLLDDLSLGRLHDGGLQLLLLAQRLLFLDQHLLCLADLIDAGFLFGDLLLGDGGGERSGLLCLGLLALHRGVELGLLRLLVAQRHVVAGDLDVGHGLNGDGHTLLGVGALDFQWNRDDVQ